MKTSSGISRIILFALGITLVLFVVIVEIFGNPETWVKKQSIRTGKQDSRYIFLKLLEKLDYDLKLWTSTLPPPEGSLVIVADQHELDLRTAYLKEWAENNRTIMIFGYKETSGLAEGVTVYECDFTNELKTFTSDETSAFKEDLILFRSQYLMDLRNSDFSPLYSHKQGDLFAWSSGKNLLICSDSAFIRNTNLEQLDTAIFLNKLLSPWYGEEIYLAASTFTPPATGLGLGFLFKGYPLFFTFHFLLAALVFILWKGPRIAAPNSPATHSLRQISQHLKGVGYFYMRQDAADIVESINRDYFGKRLHELIGLQRSISPGELAERISTTLPEKKEIIYDLLISSEAVNAAMLLDRMNQRREILDDFQKTVFRKNRKEFPK